MVKPHGSRNRGSYPQLLRATDVLFPFIVILTFFILKVTGLISTIFGKVRKHTGQTIIIL
jgi:hypothetical protein